jgi:hypothetical protein
MEADQLSFRNLRAHAAEVNLLSVASQIECISSTEAAMDRKAAIAGRRSARGTSEPVLSAILATRLSIMESLGSGRGGRTRTALTDILCPPIKVN